MFHTVNQLSHCSDKLSQSLHKDENSDQKLPKGHKYWKILKSNAFLIDYSMKHMKQWLCMIICWEEIILREKEEMGEKKIYDKQIHWIRTVFPCFPCLCTRNPDACPPMSKLNMEDNLNIFENGRGPNFFSIGRRPQFCTSHLWFWYAKLF